MKRYFLTILVVLAMTLFLCACSQPKESAKLTDNSANENKPEDSKFNPGTYEATAEGYHGEIKLTVEIGDKKEIKSINVKEHTETEGIGTIAVEKFPIRITQAQSFDIETVAGATVTCNAIKKAASEAISLSGINPSEFKYTASSESGKPASNNSSNKKIINIEKAPKTGSIIIKDAKNREVTIQLPISSFGISTMDVIDYIVPLKGEKAFKMLAATGNSGGKKAYDDIYFPMFPDLEAQVGIISEHNAPFDLEMILSKAPDVLIVNSAMQAHKYALDIEEQLTQAGIALVLIDIPSDISTSVQSTLSLLGKIFEEEENAAQVCEFIDKQFDLINSKNLAARKDKPTYYYEKSGYSEIYGSTSSGKSGWGAVISYAGGQNIADEILMQSSSEKGGSNVLDPEYVLKSNPDYIILSGVNSLGLGKDESIKDTAKFDILKRTGWENLKAVKDKNVHEIMHEMSRTIYSFYPCLYFAKTFYPEEFSDVNPDAILAEFFDKYTLIEKNTGIWSVKAD